MKYILLTIFVVLGSYSLGQVEPNNTKRTEKAKSLIQREGYTPKYVDVKVLEGSFNYALFSKIERNFYSKEDNAFFDVQLIDNDRRIRVFYFDYITIDDLKKFVLSETVNVTFTEPQDVQM